MPSLSDSEVPARRTQHQQGPRPRHFLRRGAVTELVDPSAGHPRLQGIPPDWLSGVPELPPRPPSRPSKQKHRPGPPPPDGIMAPLMPRAHARFRAATNIALMVSAILLFVAAGLITWALVYNVSWPKFLMPWKRKSHNDTPEGSRGWSLALWRPWMTTFLEGILIIIKACLCTWGAYSIIAKGLRCLVESMIQKSSPRRIANIEVIIDTLALIGFAVFPTAMAAAVPAIVPEGSCNPQFNVHRFLPLRTRDDIKGILESWVGLLMVHGRTGMSLQQFGKWRLTLARVAVWLVSLVGWVTVEVYMGPCWYLPRVWKFWFSTICISLMSWFLGNAESLIVTKWELLGKVHVQLALYLWVLYFVRWVNLDGYCVRPTCW